MKNVFLDLGTHYGQGLRDFIIKHKMNESWIIHTFEANPITHVIFKSKYQQFTPWVISHNVAVSDRNGTITVNLESFENGEITGQGTSVISMDNWDPWRDGTTPNHFIHKAEVPCIDLSQFIIENFSKDDNIIIKMDIEGSEYDTLEKMIETGAIEYVNTLVVEWHSRYFTNKDEILEREKKISEKIKNSNILLETWV
jgi:FkbM family methyltransferase